MTKPMKQGALARVISGTNELTASHDGVLRRYGRGFEFEVEDYVPDGQVNGEPCAFYWGNVHGGMSNVCVLAEDVEQVKSAEEMAARRIPTKQEIARQIRGALMSDFVGFRFDESDRRDVEIELYGRTDDGLPFGCAVTVERVWRTDD